MAEDDRKIYVVCHTGKEMAGPFTSNEARELVEVHRKLTYVQLADGTETWHHLAMGLLEDMQEHGYPLVEMFTHVGE